MALTLSQLQVFRDALVTAIAAGVTELSVGDKTIRYKSTGEMKDALAVVESEIRTASGTTSTRISRIYLSSSKGA